VDPTNSSNIYLAAAGGGVWNTTDGGTTWTPLTDTQTTLAMGSIAIAPTNPLKIYAGTGEANNALDCNHGEGILVSDDGGSTWTLRNASGALAGVVIGQIAVDPTNANVAYAAVGGNSENGNNNVNTGVWKTTDGGTTWTNMTGADSLSTSSAWSAVAVDPNTPTTLYAAIGSFYTDPNNGVYRSTDGGLTWSILANGPNSTALPTIGRIALAVSPAAKTAGQHVLYVAVAETPYQPSPSGGLIYFARSDNADAATPTFTNLTSGTPDFLGGENGQGQGWYDIAVAVDANGDVYCSGVEDYGAGGTDAIITSSNLGVNWTDISIVNTVEPHTDNHAIAFDSSNRVLAGNDGGIYRYDPTIPSWTDLNSNLETIQFTGIGLHPTDLGTVVGGSQDNGTELYTDNVLWVERAGGDGGYAKISQTNPLHCYHEYTGASIERSDDGCMTFTDQIYSGLFSNIPDSPDSADFYAPYTLDRSNGDHLLYGTDYVNESTDAGNSWVATGTPGTNNFNPADSNVDSIAISPANGANPQVIYASVGGSFAISSQIFVTSNDGASWTERDLPACTVNSNSSIGCRVNQIVNDPNDLTGQTAFAVTNRITGGGRHVYRTINEGATWTDITANLPDSPTWSVQVDTDTNQTAYVSNELGVYSSPSPYSTWTLYGTGLPHAQGVDLELNSSLHVLGLATHGRGAWEILTPGALLAQTITFTQPASPVYLGVLPITLTATGGASGDPVTFSIVSGPGSLSGTNNDVLTVTGAGTIVIAANQAGNANYAAAPQVTRSITVITPVLSVLTAPSPSSLLTGATVTFKWSAGTGVTQYDLHLSAVAAGDSELYSSGRVTRTYTTVSGLPTNGKPIFARLYSVINGILVYNDYTYSTGSLANLTSPAPGSLLMNSSVKFTWSAGVGVAQYDLHLSAVAAGGYDLYSSGHVTRTSMTVSGLPTNGKPIFARLYSFINGVTFYNDYTFSTGSLASLTSPAPSSTLTSTTVLFKWTAGIGVTQYDLHLSAVAAGDSELYSSGRVTRTSTTVYGLPTNGKTIYARLYSVINGVTFYNDYTYTAK
jgi:hypothetical protein